MLQEKSRTLLIAFSILYAIHVSYGFFYLCCYEEVGSWVYRLVFLVGLNALGFLVWVSTHRWIPLGNILIHLVGALGEGKNVLLGGGIQKIPLLVTHALMLLIFLFIYLRSK
jgi:hypothetical protein